MGFISPSARNYTNPEQAADEVYQNNHYIIIFVFIFFEFFLGNFSPLPFRGPSPNRVYKSVLSFKRAPFSLGE